MYDSIDIDAKYCGDFCLEDIVGECKPEPEIRKWSTNNWDAVETRKNSEGELETGKPEAGDDVKIPCGWHMMIDEHYIELDNLNI